MSEAGKSLTIGCHPYPHRALAACRAIRLRCVRCEALSARAEPPSRAILRTNAGGMGISEAGGDGGSKVADIKVAEREGIRTPDTAARVPHLRRLKPLSHLSPSRGIRQKLSMHEARFPARSTVSTTAGIRRRMMRESGGKPCRRTLITGPSGPGVSQSDAAVGLRDRGRRISLRRHGACMERCPWR
jgi:hypothetical protein